MGLVQARLQEIRIMLRTEVRSEVTPFSQLSCVLCDSVVATHAVPATRPEKPSFEVAATLVAFLSEVQPACLVFKVA